MTSAILESPVLASPEAVVMQAMQVMTPPPKLKMSEWVEAHLILSPKLSPEPGPFRVSRIPYAREPMDTIIDPRVREVTAMWAAQCAKTTVFIDVPAVYYMHQDPSRIAVYLESEDKQKTWSLTRLSEMIEASPSLYGLLSHRGGPDSRNSLFYKEYPGGRISILNAGSEGDLASMSQRIVEKDEIDKWKMTKAGEPDSLADKRAQNSFNRKIINVSTPRDHNPDQKIYSRITVKYEASDKRTYYVPCPFCKHEQVLREAQLKFIDRSGDEIADAKYECEKCGELIAHRHKRWMLEHGRWIAEKPFKGHAGFWLSAMYSPWISWKEYGEAKLKMVRAHETHKAFQNEWRSLPWNPLIEYEKDLSPYLARREYYEKVPLDATTHLTCMVDIQKDRIEADVRAWGVARESWGIEHRIFWGEPAKLTTGFFPEVWDELEGLRQKTWEHESGEVCHISRMFIDMSYLTFEVLKFCKGKRPMVWPARGMSDVGSRHPLVGTRPVIDQKGRYKYFQIGPNEAKDIIFSNLAIEPPKEPGQHVPGYMHFNQTYDEEYFKQLLTSEIARWKKGIYAYEKVAPNVRNEGLDLCVGNLAAFESMRMDPRPYVEALRRRWEERQGEEVQSSEFKVQEEETQSVKPNTQRSPQKARRKGGWVTKW